MKNLTYAFLLAAMYLFVGCQPTEQAAVDSVVFDIEAYTTLLKEDQKSIDKAWLISDNTMVRDTIQMKSFSIDSILPIILDFDFNRRERAGEFEIKTTSMGDENCVQYIPNDDLDILFLTVCHKDNKVTRLEGGKIKNSLLGALSQSYRFVPEAYFELNSMYVDKVGADTLRTVSTMHWSYK